MFFYIILNILFVDIWKSASENEIFWVSRHFLMNFDFKMGVKMNLRILPKIYSHRRINLFSDVIYSASSDLLWEPDFLSWDFWANKIRWFAFIMSRIKKKCEKINVFLLFSIFFLPGWILNLGWLVSLTWNLPINWPSLVI